MESNINGNLGAFMSSDSQNFIIQAEEIDEDPECSMAAENTDDSNHGDTKSNILIREQDRFLPIANVAKIMKKAIPESGKIAKDARECVQECVSEFISFITSEASDRCHMEKRKTINGEDILFAMTNLGFDNYVEPLKLYLQKYREATKGDKPLASGELYDDISEDFGVHRNIDDKFIQKGRVCSSMWTRVKKIEIDQEGTQPCQVHRPLLCGRAAQTLNGNILTTEDEQGAVIYYQDHTLQPF